jgi:hypothetical protein
LYKSSVNGIYKIVKQLDIRIAAFLSCSPVEGKGYKNVLNLPDWQNKPKKIKKS